MIVWEKKLEHFIDIEIELGKEHFPFGVFEYVMNLGTCLKYLDDFVFFLLNKSVFIFLHLVWSRLCPSHWRVLLQQGLVYATCVLLVYDLAVDIYTNSNPVAFG